MHDTRPARAGCAFFCSPVAFLLSRHAFDSPPDDRELMQDNPPLGKELDTKCHVQRHASTNCFPSLPVYSPTTIKSDFCLLLQTMELEEAVGSTSSRSNLLIHFASLSLLAATYPLSLVLPPCSLNDIHVDRVAGTPVHPIRPPVSFVHSNPIASLLAYISIYQISYGAVVDPLFICFPQTLRRQYAPNDAISCARLPLLRPASQATPRHLGAVIAGPHPNPIQQLVAKEAAAVRHRPRARRRPPGGASTLINTRRRPARDSLHTPRG